MKSGPSPRVLVGCPTYQGKAYILDRYAARVKELDYPNYDILLVDNSEDGGAYRKRIERLGLPCVTGPRRKQSDVRLAASRNVLRERAVLGGYDYYFSLEQDVIPPRDILTRLVGHKKDVVGGWYYNSVSVASSTTKDVARYLKEPCLALTLPSRPQTSLAVWREKERLSAKLGSTSGLLRVDLGSLGVTLLSRRTLEEVPFHYDPLHQNYDDVIFFRLLKSRRIPAFVDTDLLVPHFQG